MNHVIKHKVLHLFFDSRAYHLLFVIYDLPDNYVEETIYHSGRLSQ